MTHIDIKIGSAPYNALWGSGINTSINSIFIIQLTIKSILMNNTFYCPRPDNGSLAISFNKALLPVGYIGDEPIYNLFTPSVQNPSDFKYLELIQKNLGWGSLDVIKAYNTDQDAVIYLGKWEEVETKIQTRK